MDENDGTMQELVPQVHEARQALLEAEYQYAIKSKTHLWLAVVGHHIGETALDTIEEDGAPILDVESVRTIQVGCYICETPFSPRERHRKCKGEPR